MRNNGRRTKKTVKENEIPLKSGEANFEVDGYQNATSITKEVNIDGEWVIFKKYDLYNHTLDGLKYCYYIKGHLNNAAIDNKIIVLSENEDITVNDEWESVETITGEPLVWNMLAYGVKKNDVSEININFEHGYGELKPGFYRLKKEFMDFRAAGDYDTETYEVYFTIE